ncbi:MAG: hypothetical protein KDA54_07895 [Phycisphaerales bacterium]|nr:hypothetical protein [Phycisphaerales bacterium]
MTDLAQYWSNGLVEAMVRWEGGDQTAIVAETLLFNRAWLQRVPRASLPGSLSERIDPTLTDWLPDLVTLGARLESLEAFAAGVRAYEEALLNSDQADSDIRDMAENVVVDLDRAGLIGTCAGVLQDTFAPEVSRHLAEYNCRLAKAAESLRTDPAKLGAAVDLLLAWREQCDDNNLSAYHWWFWTPVIEVATIVHDEALTTEMRESHRRARLRLSGQDSEFTGGTIPFPRFAATGPASSAGLLQAAGGPAPKHAAYFVLSARKGKDGLTVDEYAAALREAGYPDPAQPPRFSTAEEAEALITRLQKILPGSHWMIAEQEAQ